MRLNKVIQKWLRDWNEFLHNVFVIPIKPDAITYTTLHAFESKLYQDIACVKNYESSIKLF